MLETIYKRLDELQEDSSSFNQFYWTYICQLQDQLILKEISHIPYDIAPMRLAKEISRDYESLVNI